MKFLQSPPLLEHWLTADPEAVPTARHKAMRICTEAGISEDDCFELDLALGEALANAVTHAGSAQNAPSKVHLGLWSFQSRLIIQVQDYGTGFNPPVPPYKMPDAALEDTHGRGLPLMEMLTDAMVVCQGCATDGGSSVFLVKRMPQ